MILNNALAVSIYISENAVDEAWKITPLLFQNDRIYNAVSFLKTGQDDFFVRPGEINEIFAKWNQSSKTGFYQRKFENSLQNAFKAIEAIIGDPPKDNKKFFAKIKGIGLDPFEEFGYLSKDPLHVVIPQMNAARDKKAAHGSTKDRIITLGEMMTYQDCAHLIVAAAIKNSF